MCMLHTRRVLPLQVRSGLHPERPDFYPLPKWPPRRANTAATKIVQTPFLPINIEQSEHNIIITHFIIFEMALGTIFEMALARFGPSWPKSIRRGARCQRPNPNDNTKPWKSSESPSKRFHQIAALRTRCTRCSPIGLKLKQKVMSPPLRSRKFERTSTLSSPNGTG